MESVERPSTDGRHSSRPRRKVKNKQSSRQTNQLPPDSKQNSPDPDWHTSFDLHSESPSPTTNRKSKPKLSPANASPGLNTFYPDIKRSSTRSESPVASEHSNSPALKATEPEVKRVRIDDDDRRQQKLRFASFSASQEEVFVDPNRAAERASSPPRLIMQSFPTRGSAFAAWTIADDGTPPDAIEAATERRFESDEQRPIWEGRNIRPRRTIAYGIVGNAPPRSDDYKINKYVLLSFIYFIFRGCP